MAGIFRFFVNLSDTKNPALRPGFLGRLIPVPFLPESCRKSLSDVPGLLGCRDPESGLIAFDIQNDDFDIVANDQSFS